MRVFTISVGLAVALWMGLCQRTAAQENYLTDWNSTEAFSYLVQDESGGATESESEIEWEWESESESSEEEESPYDEPIETERHDFTQSTRVVGRGVFQIEYGLFYAFKEEGTERETTYETPEMLLRFGLTDRLELRVRSNYAWKFNNESDDIDGAEDTRLSIKYQLTEQQNLRPESAVELRMSVATGGDEITTGRWQPGIDFIYGWELGEYFTLAGSTGANANAVGDVAFIDPEANRRDQFVVWTQSVAIGAKLNSRSTGYFEWFGLFTQNRDDELSQNFLNFGVDYLLSNNVVIDVRLGWGLNQDSDDVFAGIGGAFRF